MWIVYYFYHHDGTGAGTYTFSGNSHQRRKAARDHAKGMGFKATYKVWKYRKGEAYTNGSFTK